MSSSRRHTRVARVTGVQTCALPICESQLLRRHDLDRLAIGGIAALPRWAVLDLELAEAGERDVCACRGSIGDRDENGIHDLLRVCFGQAVIGGARLGEVGVVHSILLIGIMTGASISDLEATNAVYKAAMSARRWCTKGRAWTTRKRLRNRKSV